LAAKTFLTDRFLRALKPAPRGQRVEIWDSRLSGFGIRVSDTKDAHPSRRGKAGKIFFILYARFSPGAAPTRRTIGIYGPGAMSLEQARAIAGEWRSQVARGIDPAVIEAERRAAEARERALRVRHSFTVVAEAFIADKLAKERNGNVAERNLRNTFIPTWAERPVGDITALDVLEIINTKKATAPKMAGAQLTLLKRFFNWVVDAQVYGLTASPCDRLKMKAVAGEMRSRDRRLNDNEVFALWRATGRMGYPVGSVYRTLILAGLRLKEAAEIAWPEVGADVITIPASRMKGREGKATEHQVPITQALRDVIASVPRIKNGKFLFSYKAGKQPVTMTAQMKVDLDRRMLRTLKALARRRGEDHYAVELPPWVNHDLRRTIRSGLAALRIPHNVAEAVLAHRPPGIVGTYNIHDCADEKREALEAWAGHIASLAAPATPATVINLPRRRR
jgi:Arm DNA-binding domain/Phage integrase family